MLETQQFESEDEFTSASIDRMQELGKQFAKHKSTRSYLENYRKIVRAQIAEEKARSGIKAAIQQTQAAEADPRYHQVVQALRSAIELETRAYWELKSLEIKFEHWRTSRADFRAAMNMK